MTPRILVLSVLDPRGKRGLAPALRTIHEFGVEAVPVPTGILAETDSGEVQLRKIRAGVVEAAAREALKEPLDGMLVGMLPSYWQARAVTRVLSGSLPETLVYAPFSCGLAVDQWVGARNWQTQMKGIVPEATTVVLPSEKGGELLLQGKNAEPSRTAAAILDSGAHSAWLVGRGVSGRGVDVIAHGNYSGVIDYPAQGPGDSSRLLAASLAALLAQGLPLVEAVEQAHRFARRLGSQAHLSAVRR